MSGSSRVRARSPTATVCGRPAPSKEKIVHWAMGTSGASNASTCSATACRSDWPNLSSKACTCRTGKSGACDVAGGHTQKLLPGVARGEEERIFDKFYTGGAHESKNRQLKGGGLGLAICRGIIYAHGGKIWAHNAPEGGPVFTFTLPIKSAESE